MYDHSAPTNVSITATPNGSTFALTWGANASVAGLHHYDVDVSVDGGAWQSVVANTQATSTNYTTQQGQSYVFRVIVTDNLGRTAQAETGAQGKRVNKYYALGGQRVAMRADSVVYYLHGDHLGSTSLVTCGSSGGCNGTAYQGVVSRQWYDPYGSVRASEGTLPTDFTFTGQRADATGLMFYRARYYHAALGRFLSPDTIIPNPVNPQLFNRYSYAGNNPILYNDPDGHCGPLCVIALVIFFAGLTVEMTASNPMPPEVAPPPQQNIVGFGLMAGGAGLMYGPGLIAGAAGTCANDPQRCAETAERTYENVCEGGQCAGALQQATNAIGTAGEGVSRFTATDAEALTQFGNMAASVQAARGYTSWGTTWGAWAQLGAESESAANNVFLYRSGGQVAGAMRVVNGTDALRITHLEGFGGGAGTRLLQTAVGESIVRGFGGRIELVAAEQAIDFYQKLGGTLVDPSKNLFVWSEEAAKALLKR